MSNDSKAPKSDLGPFAAFLGPANTRFISPNYQVFAPPSPSPDELTLWQELECEDYVDCYLRFVLSRLGILKAQWENAAPGDRVLLKELCDHFIWLDIAITQLLRGEGRASSDNDVKKSREFLQLLVEWAKERASAAKGFAATTDQGMLHTFAKAVKPEIERHLIEARKEIKASRNDFEPERMKAIARDVNNVLEKWMLRAECRESDIENLKLEKVAWVLNRILGRVGVTSDNLKRARPRFGRHRDR